MEFQNSFFQTHQLLPDTFYDQLLFDVLLENAVISDMLGIHASIYETRRLNQYLIVIAIYFCEYVFFLFYRYLKNQSVDF